MKAAADQYALDFAERAHLKKWLEKREGIPTVQCGGYMTRWEGQDCYICLVVNHHEQDKDIFTIPVAKLTDSGFKTCRDLLDAALKAKDA